MRPSEKKKREKKKENFSGIGVGGGEGGGRHSMRERFSGICGVIIFYYTEGYAAASGGRE